jgi:hypothetical protein
VNLTNNYFQASAGDSRAFQDYRAAEFTTFYNRLRPFDTLDFQALIFAMS